MNILMIYPSWEERSVLGFERDIEASNIDELILFENTNPINSDKIAPVVSKIEEICKDRQITCKKVSLDFGRPSQLG